jgi:hypothetical protein
MQITKNSHLIGSIEDWFTHAPPRGGTRHWRDGRSAKECARAWYGADPYPCVPSELQALLNSHPDVAGARVESATPEHRVAFDKLGEPRNSDLVAIASHPRGNVAISVEAKADESFDRIVTAVLRAVARRIANDEHTNHVRRIQDLSSALLPPWRAGLPHLGELHYQLLTGVAGALRYALDERATAAVFVVHEFVHPGLSPEKLATNAACLDRFVARVSDGKVAPLKVGTLVGPLQVPGAPLFGAGMAPPLYIGKARRDLLGGA